MNDRRPIIPHVDDTVPPARLHERCEEVAVPNFDWISQPLVAVVDGVARLLHVSEGDTDDQSS